MYVSMITGESKGLIQETLRKEREKVVMCVGSVDMLCILNK